MRTCAKVSLNDCKQANGVTYCYCKNELCNNPSRKLDSHVSGVASNHEPANLGLQIHHVDPSRGTYIWLLVCFYLAFSLDLKIHNCNVFLNSIWLYSSYNNQANKNLQL